MVISLPSSVDGIFNGSRCEVGGLFFRCFILIERIIFQIFSRQSSSSLTLSTSQSGTLTGRSENMNGTVNYIARVRV